MNHHPEIQSRAAILREYYRSLPPDEAIDELTGWVEVDDGTLLDNPKGAPMKVDDFKMWRDAHGDLLVECPAQGCSGFQWESGRPIGELVKAARAHQRDQHPAGR